MIPSSRAEKTSICVVEILGIVEVWRRVCDQKEQADRLLGAPFRHVDGLMQALVEALWIIPATLGMNVAQGFDEGGYIRGEIECSADK